MCTYILPNVSNNLQTQRNPHVYFVKIKLNMTETPSVNMCGGVVSHTFEL